VLPQAGALRQEQAEVQVLPGGEGQVSRLSSAFHPQAAAWEVGPSSAPSGRQLGAMIFPAHP